MIKERNSKIGKFLAVLLMSMLVLQTAFFGFVTPAFAAEKANDDEGLVIEGDIDLFQAEYKNESGQVIVKSSDGRKVIAPGTSWEDSFKIVNKHDKPITYTFKSYLVYKSELGTTDIKDLAMDFKLLRDGEYIAGDDDHWVRAKDFNVEDKGEALGPGKSSEYQVKWQWPFEESADQDLKDTMFGNDFDQDGVATLTIHFEAIASERELPEPATVTGRTIETMTFVPEADQEYSIDGGRTWRQPTEAELQNERMSYIDLDEFTSYSLLNRYIETPELDPSSPARQMVRTRAVDTKEMGEAFVNNDGSTITSGSNLEEIASNGNVELFVNHDGNYEIRTIKNIDKTVNIPNNWEDTTLDMNGKSINGLDGKDGTNGTDGEIAMNIVKGTHHEDLGTELLINGPGSINGGDGGDGTQLGGNGGIAIKVNDDTNSKCHFGKELKIYAGDGGDATSGNGGKGATGVEGNIGTTEAEIYGGDGGDTAKGNGGDGGAGVVGNIELNLGKIYGGDGGDTKEGDGGNGGAGVIGDVHINKGEIYGGNGGDSENGNGGKGGDGVIGHVDQNDGIIKAGEGGKSNKPGGQGEAGKDINTGDFNTILLYVVPALLVIGALIAILILRKRRNEKQE